MFLLIKSFFLRLRVLLRLLPVADVPVRRLSPERDVWLVSLRSLVASLFRVAVSLTESRCSPPLDPASSMGICVGNTGVTGASLSVSSSTSCSSMITPVSEKCVWKTYVCYCTMITCIRHTAHIVYHKVNWVVYSNAWHHKSC